MTHGSDVGKNGTRTKTALLWAAFVAGLSFLLQFLFQSYATGLAEKSRELGAQIGAVAAEERAWAERLVRVETQLGQVSHQQELGLARQEEMRREQAQIGRELEGQRRELEAVHRTLDRLAAQVGAQLETARAGTESAGSR
jgi:hypothetical protein